MKIAGPKLVFGFYGLMGGFALVGLLFVLWIRSQPVVQVEQRNLARVLANAYQKYHIDANDWPTGAYDAAASFASESPTIPAKVKKAEAEWGLVATLVDPEGPSPTLKITYAKPTPLELTFLLDKEKKRRR